MKNILLLFIAIAFFACKQENNLPLVEKNSTKVEPEKVADYGIVIHGGAGFIKKENISDSLEKVYKQKLQEAILAGNEILKNGGKAVDAVKASIVILENSPLFNAGKGAVLSHEEKAELDASIMDGKTLNAGAVAGVTTIKNPILLAEKVMINSKHVMLSGKGAEKFGEGQKLEMVSPEYFITEKQLENIKRIKTEESKKVSFYDPTLQNAKFGTVGCVALDKNSNLAAGTSTGGMSNKKYGRIGDSPIIGAGTYANNQTCAVSSTGWGEYYIRGVVAYDISTLMEYKRLTLEEATKEVIHKKQPQLGGNGGIIAIDRNGNISMEMNTPGMFRASLVNEELDIQLYGKP
ncbi:isoaspartyl peptidase/L-asparaginase family protein [Mesonia sp. K7]|uniref:isoaspartyl peptidase/L-asparaginase family protein n=1 Tax=Mesonia sp. K7 TaxID=2218606 RepID=UPI000DA97778|nr:isoaspartyl peptidase/L-asparaginase [Mesonia sp. K7]PZD79046.1 beta-aspartyl-peptidase [Mesonia sp. K7]